MLTLYHHPRTRSSRFIFLLEELGAPYEIHRIANIRRPDGSGGIDPDQVKLVAADGNRSAYDRIRKGDQYQTVTVSEPIELQAWQAVDELNRAFHNEPPSGFVKPPFLVTKENINAEGGDKNTFIPSNNYKQHYLDVWGVK